MSDKKEVLKTVRAAFEIEPRINLHSFPIQVDHTAMRLPPHHLMEKRL
jgi:hypothetical protein